MNSLSQSSNPKRRSDRLDTLLGPIHGLLTPGGPLIVCGVGWAITAPFSNGPLAIGLCWWGIALLLWSIQIERPWLNVLPFPPLTVLALHLFLRWELGGLVLLLSPRGNGDIEVWSSHVAEALPINAIFTSCLVGFGALNWRFIRMQSKPENAGHRANGEPGSFDNNKLLLLAIVTGVIAIGYAFVGYFSGTLDRGAAYIQWAGKLWKPDTFFIATIRLRDLYFIILPLAAWRWRASRAIFLGLIAPTALSLLLTSMLGGRGLLVYPGLLLLSGLWLAGMNGKLFRTLTVLLASFAIIIAAIFPTMRNSQDFQKSTVADIGGRFESLVTTISKIKPESSFSEIGRDLYAWSDPYLFREPGLSQPPAGLKRLRNLIHLWTPRFMKQDRPEINDGHLIVKEIMGTPTAGMHEGRHIWFPGISFGGDLFWRFRWPGVILGSAIFGIAYSIFSRLWYQFADLNRSTASILIALYPSTFLQGPPLRSLSETIWNWFYEFPKYVFILGVITILINSLSKLLPRRVRA